MSMGDPAPALSRCTASLPPWFCCPVSTATSSSLCLGLGQTANRDDGVLSGSEALGFIFCFFSDLI